MNSIRTYWTKLQKSLLFSTMSWILYCNLCRQTLQ